MSAQIVVTSEMAAAAEAITARALSEVTALNAAIPEAADGWAAFRAADAMVRLELGQLSSKTV